MSPSGPPFSKKPLLEKTSRSCYQTLVLEEEPPPLDLLPLPLPPVELPQLRPPRLRRRLRRRRSQTMTWCVVTRILPIHLLILFSPSQGFGLFD